MNAKFAQLDKTASEVEPTERQRPSNREIIEGRQAAMLRTPERAQRDHFARVRAVWESPRMQWALAQVASRKGAGVREWPRGSPDVGNAERTVGAYNACEFPFEFMAQVAEHPPFERPGQSVSTQAPAAVPRVHEPPVPVPVPAPACAKAEVIADRAKHDRAKTIARILAAHDVFQTERAQWAFASAKRRTCGQEPDQALLGYANQLWESGTFENHKAFLRLVEGFQRAECPMFKAEAQRREGETAEAVARSKLHQEIAWLRANAWEAFAANERGNGKPLTAYVEGQIALATSSNDEHWRIAHLIRMANDLLSDPTIPAPQGAWGVVNPRSKDRPAGS